MMRREFIAGLAAGNEGLGGGDIERMLIVAEIVALAPGVLFISRS
jgi:hypothetical protein